MGLVCKDSYKVGILKVYFIVFNVLCTLR